MNAEQKLPKVHILASCRNPELLRATTLVFQTLRVGFPNAEVIVWNNLKTYLDLEQLKSIDHAMLQQARINSLVKPPDDVTIHHEWIMHLLSIEEEPFVLCDTDCVFWDKVEDWDFGDVPLAGRYVPQFFDKFTKCITRPRLHTSLLFLNPARIAEETEKYFAPFPQTPFNPRPNLIYPMFHPVREGLEVKNYFFDTCAMLYAAIGGHSFEPTKLVKYDHLQFGTLSDLVSPHWPGNHWRENHFAVFENPQLLKGAWRMQEDFYKANAV